MAEFIQIKLEDMVAELGESEVKNILSSFVSPKNIDVQDFIQNKAIIFSQQSLGKTVLVYWLSDDGKERHLVGYYTLANKILNISHSALSNRLSSRVFRYATYNQENDVYSIAAILIGQLSKNFLDGNELLISGSDLLQMALDRIREVQSEIGGKVVFLECEDNPHLIEFYSKNGFVECGKRKKDRDEIGSEKDYLIQMIMYLH